MRNSQKTVYHYSCCNISVPFHYCPPALYMERDEGGRGVNFLPSLPVSTQLCCIVKKGEKFPLPPFPPCFHPDTDTCAVQCSYCSPFLPLAVRRR